MTNIALIVLDTVRKDYFEKYFGWLKGKRFEQAFSTANWTGPAHASLFTGDYGSAVGVSSKSRGLTCNQKVLPEILQENGFTTWGWSANPNVTSKTNFDRGFDEFASPWSLENPDKDILDFGELINEHNHLPSYQFYPRLTYETIIRDCDTLASLQYGLRRFLDLDTSASNDDGASIILERAKSTDFGEQEFLFVNLMEAHTPYFPPEEYRDYDSPIEMPFGKAYTGVDDPELVRDGYDSAVRYLGDIYQEIFSTLEEDFDYIITVSDHGELLGEHHGMWNHVSGIYPELTHVPLVISGLDEKEDCDLTVSILDLYATILELTGVGSDQDGSRDLTSPQDSRTYLAEYRGPFDRSLERSKSEGLDLDKYDRDLFALIESGYYGYEDYDEWREIGDSSRTNPQDDLDELLDRMEMRRLQVDDDGDLDDGVEDQLEKLGYM